MFDWSVCDVRANKSKGCRYRRPFMCETFDVSRNCEVEYMLNSPGQLGHSKLCIREWQDRHKTRAELPWHPPVAAVHS